VKIFKITSVEPEVIPALVLPPVGTVEKVLIYPAQPSDEALTIRISVSNHLGI